MILDLDHEASLDPARSGAKAAWLARGRQSGLPVLPGLVVEAAVSRHHMALGASALIARGSGGARLAVMSEPVPLADDLVRAASSLGDRLVARSSTILEASGEWSGAFSSYVDITANELPKAVAGCWASSFSVSTLGLQDASGVEPGSIAMAVLVQPSLAPVAGGTARIEEDGSVLVDGIEGSPAPMLQGWRSGHRAVGKDGEWEGDDLLELLGGQVLDEIAALVGQAQRSTLANRCEWALADRIWLLQLGTERRPALPVIEDAVIDDPALIAIARIAARAPGRLGEDLVIPWALGGLPETDEEPSRLPESDAAALRDDLVTEVWGGSPEEAAKAASACITGLLGHRPAPWLDRVASLSPPDPVRARRLLSHFDALQFPSHANRVGLGRWEPFIASVTLAFGARLDGTPAAPGIGAGTRAAIGHGGDVDAFRPRRVVTAPQPIPGLAPLLWDASALVTETGGPAAHLFESARALGIPAVCGVGLPGRDCMVAVDGTNGIVATIPMNGDDDG